LDSSRPSRLPTWHLSTWQLAPTSLAGGAGRRLEQEHAYRDQPQHSWVPRQSLRGAGAHAGSGSNQEAEQPEDPGDDPDDAHPPARMPDGHAEQERPDVHPGDSRDRTEHVELRMDVFRRETGQDLARAGQGQ
jgi:hypothetical protein